jgi:glycosyltransferase involved in cell wall biosynthesis
MANKKYKRDDLEILIATMNRKDLLFLETTFQKPLDQINENLIIINQSTDHQLTSEIQHIKVINSKEYGLSKSRNLAIKHSTKDLCWILDDDCIILPDAVNHIIKAHQVYTCELLTFKTKTLDGKSFHNYIDQFRFLDQKAIEKVLSPEITFKRQDILQVGLQFDLRFGLGAQFQDSENYVFLDEALENNLKIGFVPQAIVKHEAFTSSDDVASNRVIYARGAIAGRRSIITAAYYQFKYVFFLWRKGYVKSFSKLWEKFMVFQHGANDYVTGFEGHRINHPKQ